MSLLIINPAVLRLLKMSPVGAPALNVSLPIPARKFKLRVPDPNVMTIAAVPEPYPAWFVTLAAAPSGYGPFPPTGFTFEDRNGTVMRYLTPEQAADLGWENLTDGEELVPTGGLTMDAYARSTSTLPNQSPATSVAIGLLVGGLFLFLLWPRNSNQN
jgi:hypothetical protein